MQYIFNIIYSTCFSRSKDLGTDLEKVVEEEVKVQIVLLIVQYYTHNSDNHKTINSGCLPILSVTVCETFIKIEKALFVNILHMA